MNRVVAGLFLALTVAGCAGQSLSTGAVPTGEFVMPGRWILAAPNAPTCGMNFTGAGGARTGKVSPEGGCPGNFYLSRSWALDSDALVINDDDNNALARLKLAGGGFEGQSTAGLSVTLSRPAVPPQ